MKFQVFIYEGCRRPRQKYTKGSSLHVHCKYTCFCHSRTQVVVQVHLFEKGQTCVWQAVASATAVAPLQHLPIGVHTRQPPANFQTLRGRFAVQVPLSYPRRSLTAFRKSEIRIQSPSTVRPFTKSANYFSCLLFKALLLDAAVTRTVLAGVGKGTF